MLDGWIEVYLKRLEIFLNEALNRIHINQFHSSLYTNEWLMDKTHLRCHQNSSIEFIRFLAKQPHLLPSD